MFIYKLYIYIQYMYIYMFYIHVYVLWRVADICRPLPMGFPGTPLSTQGLRRSHARPSVLGSHRPRANGTRGSTPTSTKPAEPLGETEKIVFSNDYWWLLKIEIYVITIESSDIYIYCVLLSALYSKHVHTTNQLPISHFWDEPRSKTTQYKAELNLINDKNWDSSNQNGLKMRSYPEKKMISFNQQKVGF
jgi:hypothetical protein